MISVYKKRSLIVHPVLLMPKKQPIVAGELELVPIDEEQERVKALMEWIAANLGYLPELPAIAKRLSVGGKWSDE